MNNSSPLVPQGSFEEQKNRNRSRVKIAVFFVLGIHVVGLLALLALGGCKKEGDMNLQPLESSTNAEPAFVEPTNDLISPPPSLAATSNTMVAPEPPTALVPAPVPVPAPTVGATEYKIAKGDNFSTLAKKFHVSAKAIAEANPGVEPTKLKIGQTIHIPMAAGSPAPGVAPSIVAPGADNGAGGEQTYSVKSGDNLIKIAGQFHVSVKALRAANNLKTDRIRVGQKLKIPASPAAASPTVPAAAPAPAAPVEPPAYAPAPGSTEAPPAR